MLKFFEEQMKERKQSDSPILLDTSLKFKFEGRQNTVQEIIEKFKQLNDFQRNALDGRRGTDRTQVPIPICSGLQGIGKTRVLHEWKKYCPEMTSTSSYCGVIVPYYNGHALTELDEYLTIEASFSWRLLHKYCVCCFILTILGFFLRKMTGKAEHLIVGGNLKCCLRMLIR